MTSTENDQDGTARVAELMKDSRLCMLTTMDPDGRLLARPMALQDTEFDGDLWFFAAKDSRKVANMISNPTVNVAFQSGTAWVSLSGQAEIVEDKAKKDALWSTSVAAWFPDGADDPNVVLVKINAEGAEYWSAPGSKVSTLIAYVKARVTGERPDVGQHETVDM